MAAAGVPTAAPVCATLAEVEQRWMSSVRPTSSRTTAWPAGKGVVVTDDRARLWSTRSHPGQGGTVVVEEFLDGPEVSLFVITDGDRGAPDAPRQDFKRVGDGDTGPNTGGMGAYAPLPGAGPTWSRRSWEGRRADHRRRWPRGAPRSSACCTAAWR